MFSLHMAELGRLDAVMGDETRLILVRHGETEWNLAMRYQGQSDSPLTARGAEQAESLAIRLAAMQPDYLITSDLGRALATAGAIQRHCPGLARANEPDLRERHFGILTGLTRSEAADRFPEIEERYLSGDPDFRIPSGESLNDLRRRVTIGLERWACKLEGQTIIAVSHGGTMGQFFREVLEIPPSASRRYKFVNCAFNLFLRNSKGEWLLQTWGDESHLENLGAEDDIR